MNIRNLVCLLVLAWVADSAPQKEYKECAAVRPSQFEQQLRIRVHNCLVEFPKHIFYFSDETVMLQGADASIPKGNDSTINFICTYNASAKKKDTDSVHEEGAINAKVEGSMKIILDKVIEKRIYDSYHPGMKLAPPSTVLREVLEVHKVALLQTVRFFGLREDDVRFVATAEFGTQIHAQYQASDKFYYGEFSRMFNKNLKVVLVLY